eukprot:jgi/Orpsp1_1/1178037/evm.model.c7180000063810.1
MNNSSEDIISDAVTQYSKNVTLQYTKNFEANLTRYYPEANTCDRESLYDNFLDGFFGKFQDSFFYTYVLQFIIVVLMYANVGKGRYWKVLFYAATAGLLGSFLENGTVAYVCLKSNEDIIFSYVPSFLACELFWITSEYAIPYLNLIKMDAFSKENSTNYIKYLIIFLSIPFIFFRILIGYERMMRGYLQSPLIHTYHGYAFSIMALADLLCTFSILYYVRSKKNVSKSTTINDYIKHSSYTILIAVDIVSTFLSVLNILTSVGPLTDKIPGNIIKPLHCLKCSFVLILAADALIFKYGANTSMIQESKNSKAYGGGADSFNNYSNNRSNNNINVNMNRSRGNHSITHTMTNNSMNWSKSNQNIVMASPFNYPSMESDMYSNSNSNNNSNNNSNGNINTSPITNNTNSSTTAVNKSHDSTTTSSPQNKSILKSYSNIQSYSIAQKSSISDGEKTYEYKVDINQNYWIL